jgi:preflagellin peptidase FlaK
MLPITSLFMFFLICDRILDFESRRLNDSWVFIIAISSLAFLYLFHFSSANGADEEDLTIILALPMILFLLFFVFTESLVNYLDHRIFINIQKRLQRKKKSSTHTRGEHSEKDNNHNKMERFTWAMFFLLLVFYLIVFFMDNIIMMNIVRIIGLGILVCLPVILILLYTKYQNEEEEIKHINATRVPKDDDVDISEEDLTKIDMQKIKTLNFLNSILSVGLIFFGFMVIIYYSVMIQIPDVIIQLFSILIWLIMFYGFYNIGLPRGGADAKALMGIMILFPIYPIIETITLNTSFFSMVTDFPVTGFIFPFAFTTLMNGALIMMFFIIGLLFYNISKHQLKFPHALLGYKLPIKQIPNKFVWPMERILNGKRKLMVMPDKDLNITAELNKFQKAKINAIWVTPKIPFIIPIIIGLILTIFFGNILFEIILSLF